MIVSVVVSRVVKSVEVFGDCCVVSSDRRRIVVRYSVLMLLVSD